MALATLAPFVAAGAVSLTACAPVVSAGARLFTSNWFKDLTSALVAGVIVETLSEPLSGIWAPFEAGRRRAITEEAERGYPSPSQSCFGENVASAVMMRFSLVQGVRDAQTDRLVVCVNNGADIIAFEPWAWQALYLFVDELTLDKTGDTLAGFQALCKISLVPSGPPLRASTTSNSSELLEYSTRNGSVEMNRRTLENGSTEVQVRASGIPVGSGASATRSFVLN